MPRSKPFAGIVDPDTTSWGAAGPCPVPASLFVGPPNAQDHRALARWQSRRAAGCFAAARKLRQIPALRADARVHRSRGKRLAEVARLHRAKTAD